VIEDFRLLLGGALVTLELPSLSLFIGSVLGLIVGLMRSSRRRVLRLPAVVYVAVFRSIPALLQLFFVYYAVPLVLNIDLPAYPAAIIAFSLYCSSYMSEVVRTGLESVPSGQWEASYSLGMSFPNTLRYVVLPQAVRISVPPAINTFIFTLKDTSLASVIGYQELLNTGLAIRDSSFGRNTIGIFAMVAGMYFVMCYVLSLAGHALERRIRV